MTTAELKNDDIYLKDPETNLYTCATCSYYTPLKNSFMKHLKTDKHKINEKPLECEYCNKLFHTKISYNNHAKTCLPENIEDDDDDDDDDDDIESNTTDETIIGKDKLVEYNQEEDLGLLIKKFGNQYDRLMIKYILMFFLHIKENMLPFNILFIIVLFMWYR